MVDNALAFPTEKIKETSVFRTGDSKIALLVVKTYDSKRPLRRFGLVERMTRDKSIRIIYYDAQDHTGMLLEDVIRTSKLNSAVR